jgi:hypothetical protein
MSKQPRQWCAQNSRWFDPAPLTDACARCRAQIAVEQDPTNEEARAEAAALCREWLGR